MENKKYDLIDRTEIFALKTRDFCVLLKKDIINIEYIKQLVRASGSVAANYIEANEKLGELGYNPIPGGDFYFEVNKKKADQLEWFYHLTGGTTHTDFFAIRPTDYAKAGENENWSDDELW